MNLVEYYMQWNAYRLAHPNRYVGEVLKFIREVEEDLTEGTCACGSKEDALREFERFVRAFSHATIIGRVRERISQIGTGKSNMRWRCVSG